MTKELWAIIGSAVAILIMIVRAIMSIGTIVYAIEAQRMQIAKLTAHIDDLSTQASPARRPARR